MVTFLSRNDRNTVVSLLRRPPLGAPKIISHIPLDELAFLRNRLREEQKKHKGFQQHIVNQLIKKEV